MSLESSIDKLAEKLEGGREDHLAEVSSMRKIFKDASLRKKLMENPAMKKLIDMLKKRESSFTVVLSNKENLTTEQRNNFFSRRKEVRFILSFFENADKTLESLEKIVAYQLSNDINDSVDN